MTLAQVLEPVLSGAWALMLALLPLSTRYSLSCARPLACYTKYKSLSTTSPNDRRLDPLPVLPSTDLKVFRSHAFTPEQPAQLPYACFADLPAVAKWFHHPISDDGSEPEFNAPSNARNHDFKSMDRASGKDGVSKHIRSINHTYLSQIGATTVPLELTTNISEDLAPAHLEFSRTEAPLSLFLSILKAQDSTSRSRVYIAQAPLPSLPAALQADVPTPDLVRHAGRGEIYDSSIWIGAAPTYTPLHRDPNPNLFVQLAGIKRIRVFRPEIGREIFDTATRRGGDEGGTGVGIAYPPRSSADVAITTPLGVRNGDEVLVREGAEDIMRGEARRVLEDAVWGEGMDMGGSIIGFEAELGVGDAVFVPKGWWHSIKGVGGGVVGSVNWWFR